MSTLIFPSSPTNGQIYPEQPIPGVNQYIYNAQSDTWDLLPADCCGGGGFWCQNSCGIYPSDLNYNVGIGTSSFANRFFVEAAPTDTTYWVATAGSGPFPHNANYQTEFDAVAVDSAGNSYGAGVDYDDKIGYLIKFAPSGETLWAKYFYHAAPNDQCYASAVAVDFSNDSVYCVVLCAGFWSKPNLVKFDSAGNLLWQKEISRGDTDVGYGSIAIAPNGDVILGGSVNDPTGATAIVVDISIVRFSSLGDLIWTTQISAPSAYVANSHDVIQTIAVDPSGDIYLGGYLSDITGWQFNDNYVFIVKLNSSGVILWHRELVGPSDGEYQAFGLVLDSLGYLYSITTGQNGTVLKYDPDGGLLWQKNIVGQVQEPFSLYIDSSDKIYIAGVGYYWYQGWNYGISYFCIDTSGTVLWQNFLRTNTWADATLNIYSRQFLAVFEEKIIFGGFTNWPGSFAFLTHLPGNGQPFANSYFYTVETDPIELQDSTFLTPYESTLVVNSDTLAVGTGQVIFGDPPPNFTIHVDYPISYTSSLNGLTSASDLYANNFFVNGLPFGQSSAICGNFIVGKYAGTGEGGYCYNNQFLGTCAGQNELYGSYNTYIGECAGKGTPGPRVSSICEVITSTILPPPYPYRGWFNYPFQAYTDSGALVEGWIDRDHGEIRSWYLPIRSSGAPVQDGDTVTISGDQVGGVSGVDDVTISLYSEETGNESWATTFIGDGAGGESYGYSYYNVAIGNYAGQYTGVTGEFGQVFIGAYAGQRSFGGFYNLFIGSYAGQCAGGDASFSNVHIGTFAGAYAQDTFYQTFVGAYSGNSYQYGGGMEGPPNVFLGAFAGGSATTSCANTYVGTYSGEESCTGSYNSTLGAYSGSHIGSGCYNVSLGFSSGSGRWRIYSYLDRHLLTGSGNTAVGTYAGSYINDDSCLNTAVGFCSGQGHLGFDCPGASSGCVYKNTSIGAYAGSHSVCSSGNFFGGYCAGANSCYAQDNVAVGSYSGFYGGGHNNIFLGSKSGYSSLGCYASGNVYIGSCVGYYGGGCYTFGNVSIGAYSGQYITEAQKNVFLGYVSGLYNTTGGHNIFVGNAAGYGNTTGNDNVFVGCYAGRCNTTGFENIFIGKRAGACGQTSEQNVFIGLVAGEKNTTGTHNVFVGRSAGENNTTGFNNVFLGKYAGISNTTGSDNIYAGDSAGAFNTTGSSNVYIGKQAGGASGGSIASGNVYLGNRAGYTTTSGSFNTFLGFEPAVFHSTGSNNVALGCKAGQDAVFVLTTESNQIIVGNNAHTNAYIKVNWTVTSDERDKTCISTIQHGRDFLQKLEPIQYNWKDRETGEVTDEQPRFGFLAQEVLEAEGEPAILVDNHDPENLKLRESMMIPVLFKIIQEMDEELRALRSEVNDLKAIG